MASFFQQIPFVRLVIPYVAGICAGEILSLPEAFYIGITLLAFISWALFQQLSKRLTRYVFSGVLVYWIMFGLGGLNHRIHLRTNLHQPFVSEPSVAFYAEITSSPAHGKSGYRMDANVLAVVDSTLQTMNTSGKILLQFGRISADSLPKYGDVLMIKSGFQEILPPLNPGGFNYRAFMLRKGILHQQNLRVGQWQLHDSYHGYSMLLLADQWRSSIVSVLHRYLESPSDIAIAQALLYGYDDDIDSELVQSFARTGTLHVLAVSGMHVGLLFLVLTTLMKPFANNESRRRIVAMVQALCIWAYALLCGCSPSILRACVMFTFLLIGKQVNRTGNPFNSLCASAMLLLVFDPNLLFHAGFQLSYAAVGGILAFYRRLYLLFTFRYRLLDEIWKVVAVTCAAQTLTLPMSIAYFHSFPTYFIPANLIIIPLTTLLIYLGLLLLIFQHWAAAAVLISKCMSLLTQFTVSCAGMLGTLPGAVLDNLHLDGIEIAAFYLLLLLLKVYRLSRSVWIFRLILLGVVSMQVKGIAFTVLKSNTSTLTIYRVKDGPAISLMQGEQAQLWVHSDTSLQSISTFQMHCHSEGIEPSQKQYLQGKNTIMQLGIVRLGIMCDSLSPAAGESTHLLITGNGFSPLKPLLQKGNIRQLIIGYPMHLKKRETLKRLARDYGIPFHDIGESGAFQVSL